MRSRTLNAGGARVALSLSPLALAACLLAGLPRVTDADVARAQETSPEVTRASLERGRTLYRSRCSACHDVYLPATRDGAQWERVLDTMGPRARLDGDETQLVLTYLETFAKPSLHPPGQPGSARPSGELREPSALR